MSFPYLERLLERYSDVPSSLHLGYWETPSHECPDPQAALDEIVLRLAQLGDEQTIVDVGCGLGSTIIRADRLSSDTRLVGVNLDSRQLGICQTTCSTLRNDVAWLCADAVRLPIADGEVDRVLCIEAAPHFLSRRQFMAEAARVLTPGGRLVGTDLFVLRRSNRDSSPEDALCERVLRAGCGLWPNVFEAPHTVLEAATSAALKVVHWEDISDHIAPNFPVPNGSGPAAQDATTAMIDCLSRLQHSGRLRSILYGFERIS